MFLLLELIHSCLVIHILAETIKLCVAEFSVFEPQLSDNRIIYLVRLSSARMTHAAVFVLLSVFKSQKSREYITVLSGELFHHLIPTVAGTDCFEIMIAVSSAASAGMVIRDISVFILDGGSASDSLGFYAAVGIGSEINKAVAAVSPVNVVVVIEYVRFLYKGIIIKHNKTEPTYTKTSLFLCEKRRFFMARTEKGVVTTI